MSVNIYQHTHIPQAKKINTTIRKINTPGIYELIQIIEQKDLYLEKMESQIDFLISQINSYKQMNNELVNYIKKARGYNV